MLQVYSHHQNATSGQAIVFITSVEDYESLDRNLSTSGLGDFPVLRCTDALPSSQAVWSFADSLYEELRARGFRYFNLCGIGTGATVAQALALNQPRAVRRLILLNASCRMRPSLGTRIIDRIEHALPLGLPLRHCSKDFDSRPQLHRLVMPTLILLEKNQSTFLQKQFQLLCQKVPNAWGQQLDAGIFHSPNTWQAFAGLLANFLDVPAKRPQKNLANEGEKHRANN